MLSMVQRVFDRISPLILLNPCSHVEYEVIHLAPLLEHR